MTESRSVLVRDRGKDLQMSRRKLLGDDEYAILIVAVDSQVYVLVHNSSNCTFLSVLLK